MTYRSRLVTVMTYIVSWKINLLPQFWEFSHYSFTKQQLSSMRKKFVLFGEPRAKNHKISRKIYLLPQFWEFSHYSFTKQQFSSMRKKFSLFGEPRTWPIQSHEKSISSHSFENFLTIPLPNSISLQCAKNSSYLQSLRHLIWILAKKWFRLGHNCDLINLDMT